MFFLVSLALGCGFLRLCFSLVFAFVVVIVIVVTVVVIVLGCAVVCRCFPVYVSVFNVLGAMSSPELHVFSCWSFFLFFFFFTGMFVDFALILFRSCVPFYGRNGCTAFSSHSATSGRLRPGRSLREFRQATWRACGAKPSRRAGSGKEPQAEVRLGGSEHNLGLLAVVVIKPFWLIPFWLGWGNSPPKFFRLPILVVGLGCLLGVRFGF